MNTVMIASKRLSSVLVVCFTISGCATRSPLLRQQCYDADKQLASVLQPLEALRAQGCSTAIGRGGGSDCYRLETEVARLAVVCPGHAPTLMANAVIAYDNHRPEEAQQFLDQILSQSRPYPDAAVLRARIALEEGNAPFARRLIEQQIKLVPDHAGLREVHAATLFLDHRLDEARAELTTAGALGAPRWRVAYHLGVIEEVSGRPEEAARLYTEALQGNPGWAEADSRLRALRAASPPATGSPR
jgi:tetratricopeptide (TPR) repeat protein